MTTMLTMPSSLNERVEVVMVSGVEGPSVYINDRRVCGNKPWGGGRVHSRWGTTKMDVLRALFTDEEIREIRSKVKGADDG